MSRALRAWLSIGWMAAGVGLGAAGSAGPIAAAEAAPAPASEPASSARSVEDLVLGVERWVVAIRVKRGKDVGVPRSEVVPILPRRLLPPDAKDYYDRPADVVTGLLVDPRGEVLTSAYNVAGEIESIEVLLPGGSRAAAKLVAVDPVDDLALLRVEGADRTGERPDGGGGKESERAGPPWRSEPLRPGSIVFAVGRSPDPSRPTVTQGIVSASRRNGNRTIQIDAKLNYGNVGGPLVDLDGRIAGVTGFVGHTWPQWGLNSGIGFATRVATIRRVLPTLREGREVTPPPVPFIGIRAASTDLETPGVPVLQVVEGSTAARAGLEGGDVILEVDSRRVESFEQLRRLVHDLAIGAMVRIKVRRGEQTLDLESELGSR